MSAPSYSTFLTEEEWTQSFDRGALSQGKKLERKSRTTPVSIAKEADGSLILECLLSDPDFGEQTVEVALWQADGAIEVEGTCSCDVSHNCQHAAAVLYLAARPRVQEQLQSDTTPGSRNVQSATWLDELEKTVSARPHTSRQKVYYRLSDEPSGFVIDVLTHVLGEAKTSLPKLEIGEAFSAAFTELDQSLCRELLGHTRVASNRWKLDLCANEPILKRLAATERLVIGVVPSEPFSWTESRELDLAWDDEGQPVLRAGETAKVVLGSRAFFIDPESRELGCAESEHSLATLKAWLSGPNLTSESTPELIAELEKRPKLQGFPKPRTERQTSEVKTPDQTAKLSLQVSLIVREQAFERGDVQAALKLDPGPSLSGALTISYGPHVVSLLNRPASGRQKIGGVTIVRNLEEEDRVLNILKFLGLSCAAYEYAERGEPIPRLSAADSAIWFHTLSQFSPVQYWTSFRARRADELRERGWEITFETEEELRPLEIPDEQLELGLAETGDGWFALSAGFIVEGKRWELQPILASLLEMGALEPGSEVLDEDWFYYYPEKSSDVLRLPSHRMRRILGVLKGLLLEFSGNGAIEVPVTEAALLLAETDEIQGPPGLKELGEKLKQPKADPAPPPKGLQATLRSYQEDGFQWMQFLAQHGLHGILADDMGLGKTLQTIAHVLAEVESGRAEGRPSLVLAPTSVTNNWKAEVKKWAPVLSVVVLQGSSRKSLYKKLKDYDLVVTSYGLLSRDIDHLRCEDFHIIALDEAQYIKTPTTQVAQAARELKGRHRLCLSGTPIENHLGELWSLMAFLMPGLLGKHEDFTSKVRTPIEKHGDKDAQARLVRRVGPLILRRTKDEVAKELPPKTEIIHSIELNSAQKDLYETVRSLMDKRVRKAIEEAGLEGSNVVFLDALMKLRQICCHPQLLDKFEARKIKDSAKMDYLVELLDTLISEGRKVLIFSQFTSMLDLIELHLQKRNFSYLKLTGESAATSRQEMVNVFQKGKTDVFMISLKAGGTGLTLTAADSVIHFDPWWNPAAENQATDRAYRIGQDKPVFVHKLLCKDTVEQRIQELQTSKGNLADALLKGSMKRFEIDEDIVEKLLGSGEV